MKRIIIALLFPVSCYAQITGVEPIVTDHAYCVHSELRIGTNLFNTSNIYVIKGTQDTVWIFGMGYGDPVDIRVYRDCTTINTSLQQDVHLVDSVVDLFSIQTPKIQYIVPHCHLDHVNQEFFSAMDSVFNSFMAWIYVHIRDRTVATCNGYCCNYGSCSSGGIFFGAPYDPPWTQPTLTRFKSLGFKTDQCNDQIKYITTSYGGWRVLKSDNTHTQGTINLQSDSLKIRILGADGASSCPVPIGYDVLPIHGNINADTVYTLPLPPDNK